MKSDHHIADDLIPTALLVEDTQVFVVSMRMLQVFGGRPAVVDRSPVICFVSVGKYRASKYGNVHEVEQTFLKESSCAVERMYR